jgi:hypothetical protein
LLPPALEIFRFLLGRDASPISSVTVEKVNGLAAASSPHAENLRQAGFANDYRGMTLWRR